MLLLSSLVRLLLPWLWRRSVLALLNFSSPILGVKVDLKVIALIHVLPDPLVELLGQAFGLEVLVAGALLFFLLHRSVLLRFVDDDITQGPEVEGSSLIPAASCFRPRQVLLVQVLRTNWCQRAILRYVCGF